MRAYRRSARAAELTGVLNEIWTAIDLVHAGKIGHGNQISRPLTAIEKGSCKGTDQMIMTPMDSTCEHYRELDMLCEVGDVTYIFEAKNTKNSDQHQLKPNVKLAQKLGYGVMYALAGQKSGNDKSRRASHEDLPEAQNIPPLEVIHISSEVRQLYITATPPS
jgi:hypothetical protein